jgi:hemerythrin-like metal-binding protein
MSSNKKALIWSDVLSVGVNAIDRDHQVIFRLLNKLTYRTIKDADLEILIEELVEFIVLHFRREEAIMEACNDPRKADHCILRSEHLAELNVLVNGWLVAHDFNALHLLRRFLRDWWTDHIFNVDKEISQYTEGNEQVIRNALTLIK